MPVIKCCLEFKTQIIKIRKDPQLFSRHYLCFANKTEYTVYSIACEFTSGPKRAPNLYSSLPSQQIICKSAKKCKQANHQNSLGNRFASSPPCVTNFLGESFGTGGWGGEVGGGEGEQLTGRKEFYCWAIWNNSSLTLVMSCSLQQLCYTTGEAVLHTSCSINHLRGCFTHQLLFKSSARLFYTPAAL
jgi:hypothetical protein